MLLNPKVVSIRVVDSIKYWLLAASNAIDVEVFPFARE